MIVRCSSGLCNKLRVLLSAYRASQILERELEFIWVKNIACGAGFYDLFENNEFHILDDQPRDNFGEIFLGHNRNRGDKIFDILEIDFSNTIVSSFMWLFLPDKYFKHSEYLDESKKIFNQLKPIKYIQDEVNNFLKNNFNTKILGVHIRRGDFIKETWNSTSETWDATILTNEINNFLKRNPQGKIFVATDDGAKTPRGEVTVKENILERLVSFYGKERILYYKVRDLNRDSKESIQDALITLLVLRKTDEFIGTKCSTFSDMVSLNRNIPNKNI